MFTYTTKVRIQPSIIKEELDNLLALYQSKDPSGELRKTKKADNILGAEEARSTFSRYNNLYHFYNRLTQQEGSENIPILKEFSDGSVLIEVVASAKGNSARIYFKPSITSLTKEVRKAIIPINDDNIFIYTDLKAAEFALRAVQAQDQDALNEYLKGGDIYMHFAPLFPSGTSRKVIKTILIANMYGKTPYSVSKDLGISENAARHLLDSISAATPKFTMLKRKISSYCMRMNGYFSPLGFDQTNLVKVADIDPNKGFDHNMAWSAYTQSALAFVMQSFSENFLRIQRGADQMFLSVFDSVIVEIKRENVERFKEFFIKSWSPLIPDDFHTGKTMYEAMYGE